MCAGTSVWNGWERLHMPTAFIYGPTVSAQKKRGGKGREMGMRSPSQEEVGGDWLLLWEKCQTLPSTLDPVLKKQKP